MKLSKSGFALIAFILLSMAPLKKLSANQVDIGLFLAGQDTLEVRLKTDFAFDTLISNVQFTIRWDALTGALAIWTT